MKTYEVTLGLGRMASHYTRTLEVKAKNRAEAEMTAKILFNNQLDEEIGKTAPIRHKFLTVDKVVEYETV